jgi:hypothetical protein
MVYDWCGQLYSSLTGLFELNSTMLWFMDRNAQWAGIFYASELGEHYVYSQKTPEIQIVGWSYPVWVEEREIR